MWLLGACSPEPARLRLCGVSKAHLHVRNEAASIRLPVVHSKGDLTMPTLLSVQDSWRDTATWPGWRM